MINATRQQEVARRLHDSGVYFFTRHRDGSGNVNRTEQVDWATAVIRVIQLTGWGIEIREEPKVDPRQLSLVPDEAA